MTSWYPIHGLNNGTNELKENCIKLCGYCKNTHTAYGNKSKCKTEEGKNRESLYCCSAICLPHRCTFFFTLKNFTLQPGFFIYMKEKAQSYKNTL